MAVSFDQELDTKGLSCPMPLVKAQQAVKGLSPGEVLKVLATDKGSVKDFQGWAEIARDLELVAQETESQDGAEVFVHYLRKSG